jgi:hypothetical protein
VRIFFTDIKPGTGIAHHDNRIQLSQGPLTVTRTPSNRSTGLRAMARSAPAT